MYESGLMIRQLHEAYHVGNQCRLHLNPSTRLMQNPQHRTTCLCGPADYSVYILTYTRDKLIGEARKKELMEPDFE
jgi:hypothetical protein